MDATHIGKRARAAFPDAARRGNLDWETIPRFRRIRFEHRVRHDASVVACSGDVPLPARTLRNPNYETRSEMRPLSCVARAAERHCCWFGRDELRHQSPHA